MFTGLVETVGRVSRVERRGEGRRLVVGTSEPFDDLKLGDSVNVAGVCQTVVEIDGAAFATDVVEETVAKTTLGELREGDRVNLERAMRADARFGGHFVLGHADAVGALVSRRELANSVELTVEYPPQFERYVVPVGSIAIDGVSLTVAKLTPRRVTVAVVPHTSRETTLTERRAGDRLNLEFDVLGKYAARILGKEEGAPMTEEWLKERGF
ncbi:MAG: riboflavin synthase [Ignavibacteriales bacterium]|nr:riboflavin synthase [Ignavibacteriales bacterium]